MFRKPMFVVRDAYGQYLVRQNGQTLQAFKREKDCKQWLARERFKVAK